MPRPLASTVLAPVPTVQENSAMPASLLSTLAISMPGPSTAGLMNRTWAPRTGSPYQSVTFTRVGKAVPGTVVRLASLGSTYSIFAGKANWKSVLVRGSSTSAASVGEVGAAWIAGLEAQLARCTSGVAGGEELEQS